MANGAGNERFSKRVHDYQAFRPRYPASIIGLLQSRIALQSSWTVVDIGSGTGLSAELFLSAGCKVIGIDPNAEMRAAGSSLLAKYESFESLEGCGESIPLPDAEADLIVCGESFQWLNLAQAQNEFRRVLKPGGYCLLLWNGKDREGSAVMNEMWEITMRYRLKDSKVRYADIKEETYIEFFGGSHFKKETVPFVHTATLEQVQGLLRSYSSLPAQGEEGFAPFMADVKSFFERYEKDGTLALRFITQLRFGRMMRD